MTTFDIEWMECMDELALARDMDMISFMESGESGNKTSSVLANAISKLKNALKTLSQKISSFFSGESSKKSQEEINQILKKHPELKNKKVQIKDYETALKENEKDIKNAKAGKKISKKGKIVIGVTTVTIGALVAAAMNDRKIQKSIAETMQELNECEKNTRKVKQSKEEQLKAGKSEKDIGLMSPIFLMDNGSLGDTFKLRYDILNMYSKQNNPNFILRCIRNLMKGANKRVKDVKSDTDNVKWIVDQDLKKVDQYNQSK